MVTKFMNRIKLRLSNRFRKKRDLSLNNKIEDYHKKLGQEKPEKDKKQILIDPKKIDFYMVFSHNVGQSSFLRYLNEIKACVRYPRLGHNYDEELKICKTIIDKEIKNGNYNKIGFGIDRPIHDKYGLLERDIPIIWMVRDPVSLISTGCNVSIGTEVINSLFSVNNTGKHIGFFSPEFLKNCIKSTLTSANNGGHMLKYSSQFRSITGNGEVFIVDTNDLLKKNITDTMINVSKFIGISTDQMNSHVFKKSYKREWSIFRIISALDVDSPPLGRVVVRVSPSESFWGFYHTPRGCYRVNLRFNGNTPEKKLKRIVTIKKINIKDGEYDILCATNYRHDEYSDDEIAKIILKNNEIEIDSYADFAIDIYRNFNDKMCKFAVTPMQICNIINSDLELKDAFIHTMDGELTSLQKINPTIIKNWEYFNNILK